MVLNQYALCSHKVDRFEKSLDIPAFEPLILSFSEGTEVVLETRGKVFVCIIGLCVDAHGELERAQFPAFFLDAYTGGGKDGVVEACMRTAGKYALIFGDDTQLFAMSDACGFLPVFYSTKELFLASNARIIAKELGFAPSERSRAIVEKAVTAKFPYNLSAYDEVKLLVPNHLLDVRCAQFSRVFPSPKMAYGELNVEQTAAEIIRITDNITKEYVKYRDIVLPLTGGWDSRMNMAFLLRTMQRGQLQCYTIEHHYVSLAAINNKKSAGDAQLAQKLCERFGVQHSILADGDFPVDSWTSTWTCGRLRKS